MNIKPFLIIVTLLLAATATTAQTTQKLTATKVSEYGLIYTLPTTVLDITIEVEKTVKQPGEFYRYAKKYLNQEPITIASTSYKLKSIVVNTRGIPCDTAKYLVQFKAGSSPYIMLNEAGCPLSINTDRQYAVAYTETPVATSAEPTILETEAATQAVTAEMLQSQSSAKRAELAAARIYELRQNRSDVISGNADNMPSDGQAMKLALETMSNQEMALTAMFLGTTQTSTEVKTITYQPGNSDKPSVIARISQLEGIVSADNLSGAPIYINVMVKQRGELPKNEKGEEKRFPKGGLAYRIPGSADITLSYEGNDIYTNSFSIAQYGIIFGLEPNLFTDKKAPAYGIFNPVTGGISELGTMQQ